MKLILHFSFHSCSLVNLSFCASCEDDKFICFNGHKYLCVPVFTMSFLDNVWVSERWKQRMFSTVRIAYEHNYIALHRLPFTLFLFSISMDENEKTLLLTMLFTVKIFQWMSRKLIRFFFEIHISTSVHINNFLMTFLFL